MSIDIILPKIVLLGGQSPLEVTCMQPCALLDTDHSCSLSTDLHQGAEAVMSIATTVLPC